MKIRTPDELLIDQIRDLYSVESQVHKTMSELAEQSPNPNLREFLSAQEQAAIRQQQRLEKSSELRSFSPGGDTSKAMQGLIKGGNTHIKMAKGELIENLILAAHVNRILYYQVAGYEIASNLATRLENTEIAAMLTESLEEERSALQELAEISSKFFAEVGPMLG